MISIALIFGTPVTDPAALPERLRLRVVALVSAVLPSVTPMPPSLRKVAGFAPARRARLGGAAIWAALDDAAFREHAAVQVAVVPASADDPVDTAARAWLARDEGWESVVAEVAGSLGEHEERDEQAHAEHARLTAQVAALQAELSAVRAEHREELERAKADDDVRCVVLASTHDRVFSSGGSLDQFAADVAPVHKHFATERFPRMFRTIMQLGKPTICAARGHVLAGALGLALACDLVVASEDAGFGTPEINVGLFPFMIMALIYRNVGRKKANEMLLLGERMTADEAREALRQAAG